MDSSAVPSSKRGGNSAVVVGLVVIGVLALGLGAWAYLKGGALAKPTPIGEILSDTRKWDQQPVTIEGQVSAPLNVLGNKMFRVTDTSGDIMVVTERGLPAAGDTVRVDGYVKQVFQIGTINETVVYETASGDDKEQGKPLLLPGRARREQRRFERHGGG